MNGWMEKNEKIKLKIENYLQQLPPIFAEFYIDMQGDGKSNQTIADFE